MLLDKEIKVQLVTPESLITRRLITHTCSCTLELPNNYKSVIELRNEFSSSLKLMCDHGLFLIS